MPRRGVALVITLIMLSMITFITVTFLLVTRSERKQVTQSANLTEAEMAVTTARERVLADIQANILAVTNMDFFRILISTNMETNMVNAITNPRPPVFVVTNLSRTQTEEQFYLDLNRNGFYDSWTNFNTWMNFEPWAANGIASDPEWIGMLENPFMLNSFLSNTNLGHSGTNRYRYRYAYIAFPVGNMLDINTIHNQARLNSDLTVNYLRSDYSIDPSSNFATNREAFLRNQGIGSFELNMAAFLCELNPSIWDYSKNDYVYNWGNLALTNNGLAFAHGLDILRYRYSEDFRAGLKTFPELFRNSYTNFMTNRVDDNASGPLQLGATLSDLDPHPPVGDDVYNNNGMPLPWPGSPSLGKFFSINDFFKTQSPIGDFNWTLTNLAKVYAKIPNPNNRLWQDTNTFYNLLSQIGTDTAETPRNAKPVYVKDVTADSARNVSVVTTGRRHGIFSGDQVTIYGAQTPGLNGTSEVTVLDGFTFELHGKALSDNSKGIYALDPYSNMRVDINFDNIRSSITNRVPWRATNFFRSVADRLLRKEGYYLARLPVFTNNSEFYYDQDDAINQTNTVPLYTRRMHRILQLTANIYDSTRNNVGIYPDYPTVFQPIFGTVQEGQFTNVYIIGYYTNSSSDLTNDMLYPRRDVENALDLAFLNKTPNILNVTTNQLIWGVPLIIGARKGYPNFNEFRQQSHVYVERKLQLHRPTTNAVPDRTNQMFMLSVSNAWGVETWNSYTSSFPRRLEMYVSFSSTNTLSTNADSPANNIVMVSGFATNYYTNIPAYTWNPGLFIMPIDYGTNMALSSNYPPTNVYSYMTVPGPAQFVPAATNNFDRGVGFPTHDWQLITTNKLFYALVDSNQIVDLVLVKGMRAHLDISGELMRAGTGQNGQQDQNNLWLTNRMGANGPPIGIHNQIQYSMGNQGTATEWRDYSKGPEGTDKTYAIEIFKKFVLPSSPGRNPPVYVMQAPFTPAKRFFQNSSWQVNDPLVHYNLGDLMDGTGPITNVLSVPVWMTPTQQFGFRDLNERYQPWGGNPRKTGTDSDYDIAKKDPLVAKSDDWDFPHMQYPSIGWLGRVHRATPWQTVYFKSKIIQHQDWFKWAGSVYTYPTNDWRLADLFTAIPHPNAAKGLMPINQEGLAAWAAVLGGVMVLSNKLTEAELAARMITNRTVPFNELYDNLAIEPSTSQFYNIVTNINNWRRDTNTTPAMRFRSVSELLAVPQLTTESPYLNHNFSTKFQSISDVGYERIPEQILGLLKVQDTRYVIYCFGQVLKPAPKSIIFGNGASFKLCTNYQVIGEAVTRSVVRFEDVSSAGNQVNPRAVIEDFNYLKPE
jgi:hypothetical protein